MVDLLEGIGEWKPCSKSDDSRLGMYLQDISEELERACFFDDDGGVFGGLKCDDG